MQSCKAGDSRSFHGHVFISGFHLLGDDQVKDISPSGESRRYLLWGDILRPSQVWPHRILLDCYIQALFITHAEFIRKSEPRDPEYEPLSFIPLPNFKDILINHSHSG